jgi:Rod binding domain-containing protein
MSDLGLGLPAIDQSLLPADIRTGSTQRKQTYEAALGFERSFIEELTKTMAATAQPSDDSSSTDDGGDGTSTGMGSDAASQSYLQMLPGTLADAMVANGGLGLARQLVPVEVTKS